MSETINHRRRRFLGSAVMTFAAIRAGLIGSANAQVSKPKPSVLPTIKPGANTTMGVTEADRCRRAEYRVR